MDLPRRELRHFILEDALYRQLPIDPTDEVGARTVEGVRLRVEWLFAGPRFPPSLQAVNRLLEEKR